MPGAVQKSRFGIILRERFLRTVQDKKMQAENVRRRRDYAQPQVIVSTNSTRHLHCRRHISYNRQYHDNDAQPVNEAGTRELVTSQNIRTDRLKKYTEKGNRSRTEQTDQKHIADIKNFQSGRIRHLEFLKRLRIVFPHPDIGKTERIAAICPFVFERVQQHPNDWINECYAIN